MNDAISLDPTALLDQLRLLCAQPSIAGQTRGLADGADAVASILRHSGLDCRLVKTPGAPIVIGYYNAGASRTLLVYGRYDMPPAGLRRNWTNDPFQPTIRDDTLYARGAVAKGELVARAAALRAIIEQHVPLNLVVVVEGESLIGSAHLATIRDAFGTVDACLWSGGSFDASGTPLLYTGVKGFVQAELRVNSANIPVPLTYAATVPNPLWTLTLALSSIKSEYEEILLEGFYDDVAPPSRAALNSVQGRDVGEQARRQAWGVDQFVAHVGGAMLTRTETFSPTCNISTLDVSDVGVAAIPARARAEVQFQLVPDQQPERVFESLVAHVQARDFAGLEVRRLPGAYPPYQAGTLPFDATTTTASIYGGPATVLPIAPFAAPAALLVADVPFVSCGLERPDSHLLSADEQVPLNDLLLHTRLLVELMSRMAV